MNSLQNALFEKETVFIENGESKEEIFKSVAKQLLEKGLVTEDFLDNLLEREENYPTGIDLSVINPNLPSIAIPHTESSFVKTRRIIPIKLIKSVEFKNMIQPDQKVEASFLFMILNDSPNEQANMLADIMDFLNRTDLEELKSFFELNEEKEIYKFLATKF